jgi:hypothetical protein
MTDPMGKSDARNFAPLAAGFCEKAAKSRNGALRNSSQSVTKMPAIRGAEG